MSLLTIIQNACDELGLASPTAVISTTDKQIKQLLALANKEGKALAKRYEWQALVKEATLTTVAAELQGSLATIVGSDGFAWLLPKSFWDRTANRPILPLSASDWQQNKSSNFTGPYPQYRIKAKGLYALPIPAAGHTWTFEYMSSRWCQNQTGDTTYCKWMHDSDSGILDEDLMLAGIIWRWLQRKGFDYGEDFKHYETQVQDAIARDGAKKILNMGGASARADISVAEGNWSL